MLNARRHLAALIVLASLAGAACSGSEPDAAADSTAAPATVPTTLTVPASQIVTDAPVEISEPAVAPEPSVTKPTATTTSAASTTTTSAASTTTQAEATTTTVPAPTTTTAPTTTVARTTTTAVPRSTTTSASVELACVEVDLASFASLRAEAPLEQATALQTAACDSALRMAGTETVSRMSTSDIDALAQTCGTARDIAGSASTAEALVSKWRRNSTSMAALSDPALAQGGAATVVVERADGSKVTFGAVVLGADCSA